MGAHVYVCAHLCVYTCGFVCMCVPLHLHVCVHMYTGVCTGVLLCITERVWTITPASVFCCHLCRWYCLGGAFTLPITMWSLFIIADLEYFVINTINQKPIAPGTEKCVVLLGWRQHLQHTLWEKVDDLRGNIKPAPSGDVSGEAAWGGLLSALSRRKTP